MPTNAATLNVKAPARTRAWLLDGSVGLALILWLPHQRASEQLASHVYDPCVLCELQAVFSRSLGKRLIGGIIHIDKLVKGGTKGPLITEWKIPTRPQR
ncbi:MAG: hypothetical protein O9327_21970, partial [Polaromonas sp.]|nr:hypothetical protein [Polaromonas sp.]